MCDEDEEYLDSAWEEDDEDPDFDEDWDPEQDEPAVVACPNCGAEVIEETQKCPSCGEWIVLPTNPWLEKPVWWVLLGLLGTGAVIWLLLGL